MNWWVLAGLCLDALGATCVLGPLVFRNTRKFWQEGVWVGLRGETPLGDITKKEHKEMDRPVAIDHWWIRIGWALIVAGFALQAVGQTT